MQKILLILTMTGALTITALADGASTTQAPRMPAPLAAGKPAGVKQAQAQPDHAIWWMMVGSLGAIVAIAALSQSPTATTTATS
jgi:hypothetical protein